MAELDLALSERRHEQLADLVLFDRCVVEIEVAELSEIGKRHGIRDAETWGQMQRLEIGKTRADRFETPVAQTWRARQIERLEVSAHVLRSAYPLHSRVRD